MNIRQLRAAERALSIALDHLAKAGDDAQDLHTNVSEAYQEVRTALDEAEAERE